MNTTQQPAHPYEAEGDQGIHRPQRLFEPTVPSHSIALRRAVCLRAICAVFVIGVFASILRDPTAGLHTTAHYLVLGIILASIFLSQRAVILMGTLTITGLLTLPLVIPQRLPSYEPVITPLMVNAIGMALALVLLYHREQRECNRRAHLRASEERLRLALAAAQMGIWDWQLASGQVSWSDQVAPLLGQVRSAPADTGSGYLDCIHPEDRDAVDRAIEQVRLGAIDTPWIEHRVVRPDGSVGWVELTGRVHRDSTGRPMYVVGTIMDTTARKQAERERERAEAQLVASEKLFRALIDNCADGVALVDRHGIIQYASPATTRILGYSSSEQVGENAFDIIHPDDQPPIQEGIARLTQQRSSHITVEFRVQHADGSWHWIEATGVNSIDDPAIGGIVVNFHDVTERKHAEMARRDSEDRYRMISELVSDYAFGFDVDRDGTATLAWVTDAFTRITGYTIDEIRTTDDWRAIVHPEDRHISLERRRRLLAGESNIGEHRIIAKDGRILWLRLYDRPVWDAVEGRVVQIFGAVQNITPIKQLEQQLSQAQKMDALGRLAGGIAHDFNNLLAIILGTSSLLLDNLHEGDPLHCDVEQIQDAAERAAALTSQLLAFSRQQKLEPQNLELNTVVTRMGQLLRRLIGDEIELIFRLAPDLPATKVDASQLEQVIMNLVINARDAMPTGGRLTVETAMAEPAADQNDEEGAGAYTVLTVTDTGLGMDDATRTHIFDPFYTTKPVGQGTGLGLATVQGVVSQSGGRIMVESTPGHGSTFRVYLPCALTDQDEARTDQSAQMDISGGPVDQGHSTAPERPGLHL